MKHIILLLLFSISINSYSQLYLGLTPKEINQASEVVRSEWSEDVLLVYLANIKIGCVFNNAGICNLIAITSVNLAKAKALMMDGGTYYSYDCYKYTSPFRYYIFIQAIDGEDCLFYSLSPK